VKNDLNRRDLLKMLGGMLLLPLSAQLIGCGRSENFSEEQSLNSKNDGQSHQIETLESNPYEILSRPLIIKEDAISIAKAEFPEAEWSVSDAFDSLHRQMKMRLKLSDNAGW